VSQHWRYNQTNKYNEIIHSAHTPAFCINLNCILFLEVSPRQIKLQRLLTNCCGITRNCQFFFIGFLNAINHYLLYILTQLSTSAYKQPYDEDRVLHNCISLTMCNEQKIINKSMDHHMTYIQPITAYRIWIISTNQMRNVLYISATLDSNFESLFYFPGTRVLPSGKYE